MLLKKNTMAVYFLDLIESIDKEIYEVCLVCSNDIFNPRHYIKNRDEVFCEQCFLQNIIIDRICYVDSDKYNMLHNRFPFLRIIAYEKFCMNVPNNIRCPWNEHGPHCAYKTSLKMCFDYISDEV